MAARLWNDKTPKGFRPERLFSRLNEAETYSYPQSFRWPLEHFRPPPIQFPPPPDRFG